MTFFRHLKMSLSFFSSRVTVIQNKKNNNNKKHHDIILANSLDGHANKTGSQQHFLFVLLWRHGHYFRFSIIDLRPSPLKKKKEGPHLKNPFYCNHYTSNKSFNRLSLKDVLFQRKPQKEIAENNSNETNKSAIVLYVTGNGRISLDRGKKRSWLHAKLNRH